MLNLSQHGSLCPAWWKPWAVRGLSLSLSLSLSLAHRHTHIVKTIQEINMCCGCCSIYRPRINLPAKMLLFASQFSNMVYPRLGLQMSSSPLLYPDTVYFLSRTRTFNTSKARKLLGYNPIVSLEVSLLPYLIVLTIICMLFFLTYVSCCFRNIATKLFLWQNKCAHPVGLMFDLYAGWNYENRWVSFGTTR